MLDQASARGEIRPVDPSFFYVALIGMCSFPMRHKMLLALVRGTDDVSAATAASYAEFVADLLMGGIGLQGRHGARTPVPPVAKVA